MFRPALLLSLIVVVATPAPDVRASNDSVWNKPVVKSSGPIWRDGSTPAPAPTPAPVAAAPARTAEARKPTKPAPVAKTVSQRAATKTSDATTPKVTAATPAENVPAAPKPTDPPLPPPPLPPVIAGPCVTAAPEASTGSDAPTVRPVTAPAAAVAPVTATPQRTLPTPQGRPAATLPPWLALTAQYRGRVEGLFGSNTIDDAFYLNRFRVQSAVTFSRRMQAVVQIQDARAGSYGASVIPTSAENTLDIREAYFSLASTKTNPWSLRVGRQEVAVGDARLFTPSDWNNSARSFDGVRGGWTRGTTAVVAFAYRPLVVQTDAVDRWNADEMVSGAFLTWRSKAGMMLEPYTFIKQIEPATAAGVDTTVYTYGGRVSGKLPASLDYNVEVAVQRGNVKAEDLMASAGSYQLAWARPKAAWAPRVALQVNAASGDTNPTDGRRETFDQLYGANHGRFGLVDRIAWRNMRHGGLVVDLVPMKTLKVKGGFHRLFLAETTDGLYTSTSGAKVSGTRATTASHVGDAVDVLFSLDLPRKTNLSFGIGYLFAGPYTVESLSATDMWTPHLAWRVLF